MEAGVLDGRPEGLIAWGKAVLGASIAMSLPGRSLFCFVFGALPIICSRVSFENHYSIEKFCRRSLALMELGRDLDVIQPAGVQEKRNQRGRS